MARPAARAFQIFVRGELRGARFAANSNAGDGRCASGTVWLR